MNIRLSYLRVLPAVVLLVSVGAVQAEEVFDAPVAGLPQEFKDAAFDNLVDLTAIGAAIDAQDASALTDAAMLLLHAERTLGRRHSSGLTSVQVAKQAQTLAVDTGDTAALKRLHMLAMRSRNEKLAEEIKQIIAVTARLGGAVRALDDGMVANVEQVTVDGFLVYRVALEQIRLAGETGDMAAINRLKKWLQEDQHLTDAQATEFRELIQDAEKKAAADGPMLMMQRLVSASRENKAVDIFKAQAARVDAESKLITARAGAAKIQGDLVEQRVKVLNDIELLKQQSLVTRQKKADLYYAMKAQYEKNRKPRKVNGSVVSRLAHQSAPQRMSLKQLRWPAVFSRYPFSTARQQYETILARRSIRNSGSGSECHQRLCELSSRVISVLAQRMNTMTPVEYVAAKKFVKQLNHSSSFPEGDEYLVNTDDKTPELNLTKAAAGIKPAADAQAAASSVPVNSVAPQVYTLFRALLEDIDHAIEVKDAAAMTTLNTAIENAPLLSDVQRKFLKLKASRLPPAEGQSAPGAFENTLSALTPVAGMEPAEWPELQGGAAPGPEVQKKAYRMLIELYAVAR